MAGDGIRGGDLDFGKRIVARLETGYLAEWFDLLEDKEVIRQVLASADRDGGDAVDGLVGIKLDTLLADVL